MERVATQTGAAWAQMLTGEVQKHGPWAVLEKLMLARDADPADLRVRGYVEILRNAIVRELLSGPKGLDGVPRLTNEFLTDYGRFNLSAQEGFLVSLIDGRLTLAKLLRLSPFDAFTALFYLARLQRYKAIAVPS